MRLNFSEAFNLYFESSMTHEQGLRLMYGTERMQRRVLHLLRRTEKKHTKRERAKHNRNMRPLVRLTPAFFTPKSKWRAPFTLMISVGNDAEIYENERMLREAEARAAH